MKKSIFKRGLSMLMATLLRFSGFVNIDTTTALPQERKRRPS